MTPTTRSSTTNENLLKSIDHLMESLKNINTDLENIKNAIQDVREQTFSLHEKSNNLEEKLEKMDSTTNDRIDKLCLQSGDIAIELEQLQLKTNDIAIDIDQAQPTDILLQTINTNIEAKLRNIPSLIKHEVENTLQTTQAPTPQQPTTQSHVTSRPPAKMTGFHQRESKDFHVSKLLKLLEHLTLESDSLKDLEIFYDTITSHFATITLTGHILPIYRDLTAKFRFQEHLCSPEKNPTLTSQEIHQAKLNYRTFGSGLRQFLINPKTIDKTTAPDSYLQLLSLKHENDGFLLFQHFIFLRSPQLEGKYIDYRSLIDKLYMEPGESIRTFYTRAMWLYNEITLAKLLDGSQTYLLEHFLKLLRSTDSQLIIAETSPHWKQLQHHRRDPTHTTKTPPTTLNSILRDLEIAGITNLPAITTPQPSPTNQPLIACSTDAVSNFHQKQYDPYAAYVTNKQYHNQQRTTKQSLQTNHNKQQQQPKCRLCNNQHPNPWHDTNHCPFKDPTFIQNRLIRENVMQHNTLYGKTNKNYTKTMDTPNSTSKPLPATIPKTIKSADIQPQDLLLPDLQETPTDTYPTFHDIPETLNQHDFIFDQLTDTQPYEPTANIGHSNQITLPIDTALFEDNSDLLFDPQHYLQFTS